MSEAPGLRHFTPRGPQASAPIREPIVWAISEFMLSNYLFPRDCPRICIRVGTNTTKADRERFFTPGSSLNVAIICFDWLELLHTCRLFGYSMPLDTFEEIDANAGYYASKQAIVAESCEVWADLPTLLAQRGVELRVVDQLKPIAREVAASSLRFSIIRLRDAQVA
ncbi:MAG: DUF6886 family protein [Opitutales bacterium]